MYRPTEPQPAGTLVTTALSNLGVYANLRPSKDRQLIVGVNNCSDNRTIYNKINQIKRELDLETDPVPVNCFGGLIRLSRHCPGYKAVDARFILNEFHTAVQALNVRLFFGGAHGEVCGWCQREGVTVAQRHWLSCDAKHVVLRAAELEQWSADPIKLCVTWHRRISHDGQDHQRTRIIDCGHPLFTNLPLRQVIGMTDYQVIEQVAPDLLNLVATN